MIFTGMAVIASVARADEPLHVLLTNDDGYEAPGLTTLHRALLDAGFRVSVVAPRDQQSGSSMRVSIGTITVQQIDEAFWTVAGSPADAVSYALSAILADDLPDIVVSGTNFGQNLGGNTNLSGTVGAAIMANQMHVPAIAVSVGINLAERDATPVRFPSTTDAFPRAAAFMVRMIRELERSRTPGEPMLPPHRLLNVNYPGLPDSAIKGVRFAHVGDTGGFTASFVPSGEPGEIRIDLDHADPAGDPVPDADAVLFAAGFITISAIDARLDAGHSGHHLLERRLGGLMSQPAAADCSNRCSD